ncbi:MAG: restriction endonuclease subunit S, partial [Muribaculaceae bacterium]
MSKLQELIDRLCPEGVEYKELGEVCETLPKGTLKTTDLIPEGTYPVINSGKELYGKYDKFNNIGPAFTIAARGEYAGWVSFFNEAFWAGGLCYPYKSKNEKILLTKFGYYYLKSIEQSTMNTIVARGSIPALNKIDIDKVPIPVPPLEVQEEIVRILDKFSSYAAELQAELQARKAQYEYYR